METSHNTKLTAAELSQIWTSYQNETMLICILKHFLETVEDPDTASLIEQSLETAQSHVQQLTTFLNGENWPTPQGFTEADVNLDAPRLFSDSFVLYYLHFCGTSVLNFFSTSFGVSARPDVRNYFSNCMTQVINLNQVSNNLLLEKGLYIRPPYLTPPENIDFVSDKNFLGNWLGQSRPLLSLEITSLFFNLQRNALGKALMMGFSQVTGVQEFRKYMVRGKEIAEKHVEVFRSKLNEDDLDASVPWAMTVTNSTIAPFSDKLMMFHATALIGTSIGFYGKSIATSLRKDLTMDYARLTAEVQKFAGAGAKIMIEHNWMEEPPQAENRGQLAKKKN